MNPMSAASLSPARGAPRCLECGYPLFGLAEHRCPECGRTFDLADPRTYRTADWSSRVRAAWARWRAPVLRFVTWAVCVAVAWALYYSPDGVLSFLLWCPIILLLRRRRWWAGAAFVLCCPLGVTLLQECIDYRLGRPHYVRPSYGVIEFLGASDDRRTRVRGRVAGCGMRSGNQWVQDVARRICVPLMHAISGPPRGAYLGPYPTESEALAALAQGQVQDWSEAVIGLFRIGGANYVVDTDLLRGWANDVSYQGTNPPAAVIYRQDCLIVRLPRSADPRAFAIYLIDRTTLRPFALYVQDPHRPRS